MFLINVDINDINDFTFYHKVNVKKKNALLAKAQALKATTTAGVLATYMSMILFLH